MRLPYWITVPTAALLFTLLPSTASAAPASQGATRVTYDYCQDQGSGTTACARGSSVFNAVSTPSGLAINSYVNHNESSYTAPNCSTTSSGFTRNNYILTQSGTQVYSFTVKGESNFS